MIAVDLETHEVLKNWEIKQRIAQSNHTVSGLLSTVMNLNAKVASPLQTV